MANCALALRDAGVNVTIKDKEGSNEMLSLCKPRKPTAGNSDLWYTREKYPEKYNVLYSYCNTDVICEKSISDALQPIPAQIREEELLTTRMNTIGMTVDKVALRAAQDVWKTYKPMLQEQFKSFIKPLMNDDVMPYDEDAQLLKFNKSEAKRFDEYNEKMIKWYGLCDTLDTGRCREPNEIEAKVFTLTKPTWIEAYPEGFKSSQNAVLLSFINLRYNMSLTKLDKTAIKMLLSKDIPDDLRTIVNLRNDITAASLKKLDSFDRCCAPDGRIHDSLKYYGATATGRWSGAGLQPQNIASRGLYHDVPAVFHDLKRLTTAEFIDKYEEHNIVNILRSSLRGYIMASKGKKFVQYDFSAIEARVVAVLGDVTKVLKAFEDGLCVYKDACKDIFGYSHEKAHALDSQSWERKVAKEFELSLCYGVGHNSLGDRIYENTDYKVDFRCKCRKVGDKIKHKCEAHRLVQMYRKDRLGVVHLWSKMEQAAIDACQNEGVVSTAGVFKFVKKGIFLYMRLPNGRTLKYADAKVEMVDRWGDGRETPQITYRGKDSAPKTQKEYQDKNYRDSWRICRLWGSKSFQHGSQAIARDIMAEALLNIEGFDDGKYTLVLSVHDEEIAEVDKAADEELIKQEMTQLMCTPPVWFPDIPLKVEGACHERFCK